MAIDSSSRTSYPNSSSNDSDTLRSTVDSDDDRDENNNTVKRTDQNASTTRNTPTRKARQSRSVKSGLAFSVSRVENHLRKGRYAEQISPRAAVYMASVLEYLVAETLELAGDMTFKGKRKRITPRDIALAIKNDHELAKLCSDVTIPEGGVQPFIHEVLLKNSQRRRTHRVRFAEDIIANASSSQNKSTGSDNDADVSSDADDSDVQME